MQAVFRRVCWIGLLAWALVACAADEQPNEQRDAGQVDVRAADAGPTSGFGKDSAVQNGAPQQTGPEHDAGGDRGVTRRPSAKVRFNLTGVQ